MALWSPTINLNELCYPRGYTDDSSYPHLYHSFADLRKGDRNEITQFHLPPNPSLRSISIPTGTDDKIIEKHTSYAKAQTYRNFLENLDKDLKAFFNSLLTVDDFVKLLMCNSANSRCVIPTRVIENFVEKNGSIDSKDIFTLLKELNIRLHIEQGSYYLPIEITVENNSLVFYTGEVFNDDKEYNYPLIPVNVTDEEIKDFRSIALSQANYQNPYANRIQTVAMISHNRTGV